MKDIEIQGIKCKIGSNAIENWELLEKSKENNLFFHLSSFPSCYVILENDTKYFPSMYIIEQVALNCKLNTKYKNLKNIKRNL